MIKLPLNILPPASEWPNKTKAPESKLGACELLTNKKCVGKCVFFKTIEEVAADRATAFKRLASLSDETQIYISEKYYHGKRPWTRSRSKAVD